MAARLKAFLEKDIAGGVLLIIATLLAMTFANTGLSGFYGHLLDVPIAVQVGLIEINKPMLLWINDGLMAIFFLLIGLEVKREFLGGELSSKEQVTLPAIAAFGGMAIPALCYVLLNYNDPVAIKGWAIPAATDIAFALGVLAMLGNRVPPSLKVFLLALAIMDDLGAIVIIALFYTSNLSIASMILGAVFLVMLIVLNRMKVTRLTPYIIVGTLLWICVLKSGVHATLAGVALAFTIPMEGVDKGKTVSPLKHLEHILHMPVSFVILPIFAFANAGVELSMQQLHNVLNPIPLGVIVGLFVGKQVGVFGFTWLAVKMGLAKLPTGASWMHIYGLALLCGIGFTMSLFVGSLAFEGAGMEYVMTDRIGIILGSLLSGVGGYCVLRFFAPAHKSVQSTR